jgi:hypothetical protein
MIHPVQVGHNPPEWCDDVSRAFEALEFSVSVEYWMLDWKYEIRIRTADFDRVREEMAEQVAAFGLEVKVNTIGWSVVNPGGNDKHPLAGWGVVS